MAQQESNSLMPANAMSHHEPVGNNLDAFYRELSQLNGLLKEKLLPYSALDGMREVLAATEALDIKTRTCAQNILDLNLSLAQEVARRETLERQLNETQAVKDKYHYLAFHDAVTGLPNRALFNDRLERALIQARRHRRSFALMVIDIDKFKDINDTFGHAAGDDVLVLAAKRLQACVRAEDTVSRAGGDEFLCLLQEVKEDAAMLAIADCMRADVTNVSGLAGLRVMVSVSIGCAICPRDGVTAEALLRNADKAMYMAKRSGTGRMFCGDHVAVPDDAWHDVPAASGIRRMPDKGS